MAERATPTPQGAPAGAPGRCAACAAALVRPVQADARALLAAMAPESVDLIVTDPPYAFARGTTYFREWFAHLPDEAWPEILRALHRVLRPDRHAYVLCDRRTRELFADAAAAAGFRLAETLVWD